MIGEPIDRSVGPTTGKTSPAFFDCEPTSHAPSNRPLQPTTPRASRRRPATTFGAVRRQRFDVSSGPVVKCAKTRCMDGVVGPSWTSNRRNREEGAAWPVVGAAAHAGPAAPSSRQGANPAFLPATPNSPHRFVPPPRAAPTAAVTRVRRWRRLASKTNDRSRRDGSR